MTKALPITELAVRRAIRAARKEGVQVAGISVAPDGTVTVHDVSASVAATAPAKHHAASSEYEDFQA